MFNTETVNVALPVTIELTSSRYGNPDPDDPTRVGEWVRRWKYTITLFGREVVSCGMMSFESREAALRDARKARAVWAAECRESA